MRRKPMIALVVGVALLVLIAVLFAAARQSSLAITVRHVKSVRSGDWVAATFEFTNHTTSRYFVYPISVEVSNALGWKKVFDFCSFPGPILDPNGGASSAFDMTNLATGPPLRLRMCARKELTLERLFQRLDLRFRRGDKRVSLNPFDKSFSVFSSKATQIVSDEFVEPGSNQGDQGASER